MPDTTPKRGRPKWMDDPERVAAATAKRAATRLANARRANPSTDAAEPVGAPARAFKPATNGTTNPDDTLARIIQESDDELERANANVAQAKILLTAACDYRDRVVEMRRALQG